MEDLSMLKRRRSVLKGKLVTANNYVKNIIKNKPPGSSLDNIVIHELEIRLENLLNLMENFQEIQSKIEEIVPLDNLTIEDTEWQAFENSYFETVALYKHILSENRPVYAVKEQDNVSNAGSSASGIVARAQLPAIPIPKFTGVSEHWLEFRDTFVSLIHSNDAIKDMEKLYFLKGALEGEAKQVIHHVDMSAVNYPIVWNMLCERYDNPTVLINDHLKLLINLPSMSRESHSDLRNILDSITKHLHALNKLGIDTNSWDPIIIFLVCGKLDSVTQRVWEEKKPRDNLPTLEYFKKFLKTRIEMLVSLEKGKKVEQKGEYKQETKFKGKPEYKSRSLLVANNISCIFCKGSHYITNCSEYLKLPIKPRYEKAKSLGLCLNCLRKGHISRECGSGGCKKCGQKHHTLLHYQSNNDVKENGDLNSKEQKPVGSHIANSQGQASQNVQVHSVYMGSNCVVPEVLLSTALVQVRDSSGHDHTLRVILDNGSQSNLITLEACKRLGLPTQDVEISIVGINQTKSDIKKKCSLQIHSMHYAFKVDINCLVVPNISSNIPGGHLNVEFEIPPHIKLADPSFACSGRVDLLLGAEVFYNLLCVGQILLGENQPMLQKTRLGWVATGSVFPTANSKVLNCNLSVNSNIQIQLEKFWAMEEVCVEQKVLSSEDRECERLFEESTSRDSCGRFIVKIPLVDSPHRLGDSKQYALNRFYALEKKLYKNPSLRELYVAFMEEYESMGHMTLVEEPSEDISYYLPHHGVLSEHSTTTRLRVVFNGSAKTDTGVSFNDIQCTGPSLQDELVAILLRFRKHSVVVCADVAKMYRMILVDPSQRSLQKILWRSDPVGDVKEYTLNTVTYGTKSAPYLAIRCIKELGLRNKEKYPLACQTILKDFYVDDMLTGASDSVRAFELCKQVDNILRSGCMELRKWVSNDYQVIENITGSSFGGTSNIHFGEKEQHKTLGLYWSFSEDNLMFSIDFSSSTKSTKRGILSDVSKIFDPLGLLGPCILIAKILLQRLWSLKLSWDETLPMNLDSQWKKLKTQLKHLNTLEIKRHVILDNSLRIHLHGFSDASCDGYGACIYLKSFSSDNRVQVSLLCSRVKVAPLKTQTIPRLELCGALLLSRLLKKVVDSMDLSFAHIYLWCDSTVVLGWIKMCPSLLQTFVSNRVSEIQSLTDVDDWRYVKSEDNAADLLSRGVFPNVLLDCSKWWNGPDFLWTDDSLWSNVEFHSQSELPEQKIKKNVCYLVSTVNEIFPFDNFSSFVRLNRTTAYVLRFGNFLKLDRDRMKDPLTSDDLRIALMTLIKIVQRQCFKQEIECLTNGQVIKNKSILRLNPFIDEDHGLLRVGGRIHNSKFSFNKKHPILLPGNHKFTYLLFESEHKILLHPGPQMLLSSIRDTYWVISGRNLARKISFKCTKCIRARPMPMNQIMGVLPEERVNPLPPFSSVGVDYAGPLFIKDRNGRGAKVSKCYICLFICLSTKAIHLELVPALTTEAFIATFRRFTARRGKPNVIFSDNGSTFIGANREIKELNDFLKLESKTIADQFLTEGLTWKFIPSYSPNFGGIWEAGVKSCKLHLRRILGNCILTFEGLYTILTQIESVLNSRPLVPLSSSPDDFEVLTPSHFLIGRRLTTIPDPNLTDIPVSKLSRYQHIQMVSQHFWRRWSNEYICELQNRSKWYIQKNNLKIGDIVILRDKDLPPLQWRLGRITKVFHGQDGNVRVANIKTKNGEVKRAVSQICPLLSD